MKLLISIFALAGSVFGQSPFFSDFSPTVKGAALGTSHVYLWSQTIAPGSVQVAAYTDAMIRFNSVLLPPHKGVVIAYPFAGGLITCILTPNALDATKVDYQLAISKEGCPTCDISKQGTF